MARAWAALRLVLARPVVAGAIALVAALALGAALSRLWGSGLDRETILVLCVAAGLALATLPAVMAKTGIRLPRLPSFTVQPRYLGGALLTGLAGLGLFVATQHTPPSWGLAKLSSGLTSKLPSIAAAEPVTGRAVVMGGDRLRIGNTLVRLSGIELPEASQLCGKPGGRQFRCGGFAATTLSRLVGGGVVSCTPEGKDSAGVTLARCMRGDKDINGELVRAGHAFAESGLVLTRYGSEEKEALAAKAGIWAAGESLRPAEWRARVWDEAKRKAPDGCPIKGTIAGNAKVYLLPWSPEYDRGPRAAEPGGALVLLRKRGGGGRLEARGPRLGFPVRPKGADAAAGGCIGGAEAAAPVCLAHAHRSVRFRPPRRPHRIGTANPRDAARLLVVRPESGALGDHVVRDLPQLLQPGDVLVVNDTRVIRAALTGERVRGEARAKVSFNLHSVSMKAAGAPLRVRRSG